MSASQVVAERIAFLEAARLASDLKGASLSHPSEGSRAPQANPERFPSSEGSREPQANPERFPSIKGPRPCLAS
jgi:hypothetical protein